MRKLALILLLVTSFANAQVFDDGWASIPLTTVQIQALVNLPEGLMRSNSDTNTIWMYSNAQWNDTGNPSVLEDLGINGVLQVFDSSQNAVAEIEGGATGSIIRNSISNPLSRIQLLNNGSLLLEGGLIYMPSLAAPSGTTEYLIIDDTGQLSTQAGTSGTISDGSINVVKISSADGTNNQVMTIVGGAVQWADVAGGGLSTENQLRIDNLNVTKRITVTSDNIISTSENARTTTSPFEGKVETLIDGDYSFLLNNAEPLNTLFTIKASASVTDSIIIKRNDPAIKFLIDGYSVGLVADDFDGVSLLPLKTAIIKRISANLYDITCACHPYTEAVALTNHYLNKAGSIDSPDATDITGWTTGAGDVQLNTNLTHVRSGTTSMAFSDLLNLSTSASSRFILPVTPTNGQTINYSVYVKADSTVRFGLRAGSPNSSVTYYVGDDTWQLLSISIVSDGNTASVYLYLDEADGQPAVGTYTAYWDDATVNIVD